MLGLTRERILERLLQVPELTDAYLGRDPAFPDKVIRWLAAVEETLGVLRNPLVSLVAAERAKLVAIDDGAIPPELTSREVNRRKSKRVTASFALGHAELALRNTIEQIDQQFDEAREKLAQLLAVASAQRPIPLPPTEPRHLWLDRVWANMSVNGETQGMFNYLAARLTQADRRYLLDEVLSNLLSNTPR